MRRLRRLLTAAGHVRPAQLARRIWLVASRFAFSRVSGLKREALGRRAARLAGDVVFGAAPRPFPARTGMFRRDGETLAVRFLGEELRFSSRIDWRAAGTGRVSQLWGFHLHYHEFLEEAGDEDFQAVVLDWIAANPAYAPRYWFDAWSSYALSLRVVVWIQQIARRGHALSPAFLDAAARSLVAQVLFLEANLETDIRGNHLLKNIKALLFASRCLGTRAAARWGVRAARLLERELEAQILADGAHFELSPAYHAQVFADLVECREVLESGPLRTRLSSRLSAMAQVLADLTHPDGLTSLFNDGGLHMTYAPSELLSTWRTISGEAPSARRDLRLHAAGFFGVRDEGDFLLVDAGRVAPDALPAHGHGDILAFEWSVSGRRLLVDTGVFEYAAGLLRDRARATASHNTVTVDAADQCEFYGSFRMGRRARVTIEHEDVSGGVLRLTARHDGFTRLPGGGLHRRAFNGRVDAFTIEDTVDGARGVADAWLILHPEAKATIAGSTARIASAGVEVELTASAPIASEPWEWWPDFGVALPTTRLRIRYGPLPAKGRLTFQVVSRP